MQDELLEEDLMVRAMADAQMENASAPAPGGTVAGEEDPPRPAVNPAIVEDIMRRPDAAAEKQPGKIELDKAPQEAPPENKIFKVSRWVLTGAFKPVVGRDIPAVLRRM